MAITIRPFTENIGSANAIMGVTQMAFSALITGILSYFQNGSAIPMVVTLFVLSGISFSMQYFLKPEKEETI
jgi:DHA1 family bicyclomycin/chloramphenicol resistance-like MFS transporter